MKSIKGNYIWWAAVHLAAGILFVVLSVLWEVEFLYVLAVCLFPVAVFNVWFNHGHKTDERERYLLLKVYSRSGSYTLVFLTYIFMGGKADISYVLHALWSLALILKGGFGLFYFIRE